MLYISGWKDYARDCWYCRYPLVLRDVRELLAERGIHVDPATINRWVIKFGPTISHHIRKLHYPRMMLWHVDETVKVDRLDAELSTLASGATALRLSSLSFQRQRYMCLYKLFSYKILK